MALARAEAKLTAYRERVRKNMVECSFKDKRLALEALDIQVKATPGGVDIKGVIPIDISPARVYSPVDEHRDV